MATDLKSKKGKPKDAISKVPPSSSSSLPGQFMLDVRQWTALVNWIPSQFLYNQLTFVVFDEWDSTHDQFKTAVLDKYPLKTVITRAEEMKEGFTHVGSCAVLNPQWGDAEMKIGGGKPLKSMLGELFTRYNALIVVGRNTGNEPAAVISESAAKMSPNPIEREHVVHAPGASVFCFSLRLAPTPQSTSFNEPVLTAAAAAAAPTGGTSAAAAAATAGR